MRLPPMNAIVAFEAAGRHESLLKAAEELRVTPGAVSRQIKRLEQTIGTDLFVRTNRKVTLTEDGRAYWTAISNIIARVRVETEQLVRRKKAPELRISCSVPFMQLWMLPRFLSFQAAVKEFNVTFTITRSAQAFAPEFDCGIRIGRDPWPELQCEKLLPAPMVAICSPDYLAKNPRIRSLDSLAGQTLLHSTTHLDHWSTWLGPKAAAVIESGRSIRLDGVSVAYQAILNGLGIGLGRVCLIGDDLIAGKLVLLFRDHVAHGDTLYLASRPGTARRPEYVAFRNWIAAEAASYGDRLRKALPDILEPK